MTNDVEHLLRCLYAIHISSLVMCLFESFAHCFIQWFVLLLSYKNFLYILGKSPPSVICFANIFFQSGGLFSPPPPSLVVFYEKHKF